MQIASIAVDTQAIDEFYMVKDAVWRRAWSARPVGRRRQFHCIGCLETRLECTLTRANFIAVPLNELDGLFIKSARLLRARQRAKLELETAERLAAGLHCLCSQQPKDRQRAITVIGLTPARCIAPI